MTKILIGVFGLAIIITVVIFTFFMEITTEINLENGDHVTVVWSNVLQKEVVEITNYNETPAHRLHFRPTPNGVIITEFFSVDEQNWDEGQEVEEMMTLADYEERCKALRD